MTDFLIKKFVLSSKLDEFQTRQRYGYVASLVGICLNILLSLLKISCGIIFNTISVLGDGINNLSDATSSIVTMVGFKMSEKPADKEHPFGHARMEYISGFVVSFIIMFIGFELVTSSFSKILHPQDVEFNAVVIMVLIASMMVKFWLYKFNKNISQTINSKAILATASDSKNDVFVTFGVLTSLFIYQIFDINLDGYVGVLLGVVIMKSAYELVTDTLSPLLGEAPDKDLVEHIYKKLIDYDNVLAVHDLIVHTYGYSRNFVSVHVEMDVNYGFMQCHEVADNIERDFKMEKINLVVHIDPVVTDSEIVNHYKEMVLGVVKNIDKRISMHDFRTVLGEEHNNLIFDVVLPCEVQISEEQLKTRIQYDVFAIDKKCYTVIEVDKHYNEL
ncbi:MAG: cation diffusion facilitator family transporter [Clostridia bacterium]